MKLFKYLGIVILSAVAIAGISSWLVNKGLKKSKVDFFGKMNAAGDTTMKIDILLVGSSRTLVQIDPVIIDSVTKLQSYNYGLNAATVKTCFNVIKYGLFKQSAAKAVVLNIDYSMFDTGKDPYKDPFFYPYQNELPGLLINDSGLNNRIHQAKVFDIAMYDDMAKYAAIDGFIRPNRIVSGLYKGFYPHMAENDFIEPLQKQIIHSNASFTVNGINILNDIINLCNKKQKKLVLVVAPYVKKFFPGNYIDNYSTIIAKVKAMAVANQVSFLDYTENPIAEDHDYFYNVNHLNVKGAKAYTRMLAGDINKILRDTIKQEPVFKIK